MAYLLAALIALAALSCSAVSQLPPSSGSSGTVSATARTAPLTERERAIHLLSRATYGVRPSDLDEITRLGRTAWLEAQLQGDTVEIEPTVPTQSANRDLMIPTQVPSALTHSKLARAAFSDRQLEEVMADFWFNHFNVYVMKDLSLFMLMPRTGFDLSFSTIAHYEEHAIRDHVFGRFEDMLIATARHPAMLVYLDNYLSTVPNVDTVPAVGISEKYARERLVLRGVGINENYARELLELHTLGVDGGYAQRDVIEVARAFTGWGVQTRTSTTANGEVRLYVNPAQTEMLFEPERHDQAAKTVMSLELPAGRGMEDGIDVLKMLAVHPSTAHHIATKLVTHFVSDAPPPELVAELTDVFLDTGGDLRAVTRALFSSDHFYERAHFRAKTKRPFEFLASALRVTGRGLQPWSAAPRTPPRPLYQLLQRMGHTPYMERPQDIRASRKNGSARTRCFNESPLRRISPRTSWSPT
jgi:uncharacterized protein (DUF1800 family)